jgi:hypothetical protein
MNVSVMFDDDESNAPSLSIFVPSEASSMETAVYFLQTSCQGLPKPLEFPLNATKKWDPT